MEAMSKALNDAQRWDVLVIELDRVWQDNNVTLVRLPPCTTLLHVLSMFSVHVRRLASRCRFQYHTQLLFPANPVLYGMFVGQETVVQCPLWRPNLHRSAFVSVAFKKR
jgi:hypothetical protein